MLLYFTLLSRSLFLSFDFIFALLHSCFALFHCALLCFMLCFPHSLQLSRLLCSCSVSLHLFALYMVYFTTTLLYFHSTIFPFALHCFVSLHYLASIYFISPCFPYFSWSSFRSGFNLISSWGHRASFHSLLNLLRWASRHSTPPYSALLRLAWTPGFGEIRAGLTALCNLLAVQERNEAQAALLILRNAF